MSRPVRHPKTGVYWFRKRVPGRLVALVGKREEKRSLATKDPGSIASGVMSIPIQLRP